MDTRRSTISAAVSLHDEVFDDAKRFARIRADLETAPFGTEVAVAAVRELENCWSDLVRAAFHDDSDYDVLLARLPSDDPARAPIGLLGLLNRTRRETLHTAAIAALVDPRSEGGTARLRALLEGVLLRKGRNIPDGIEEANVSVEPIYSLRSGRSTLYPRPDLRIEIGPMVVLVENKVDALDRERQLSSYEEALRVHHEGAELFLVYLTPTGALPTQEDARDWIPLSYKELTLRWRTLMTTDEAHGRRWSDAARAYLTTLSRDICDWRPESIGTRAGRSRIMPYLRAATGENS